MDGTAGEAHELIQRGLDHFACGDWREAAQAWESALRLQPQDRDAARLLAFVNRRMREHEGGAVPVRHDTLESPIPGYLASLTAVEGEGSGRVVTPVPSGEWAKVDTRRVLASMDELNGCDLSDLPDIDDTWKEVSVQDSKLRTGVRGLVSECKTALYSGRAETAALAAEMAFQMGEQTQMSDVHQIISSERILFERAFSNFIGDGKCAPIRAIPAEDLAQHGFDHRAAFLMSHMDGALSVSDILHVAGMPRFEALRLLAALKRARAIELVPA